MRIISDMSLTCLPLLTIGQPSEGVYKPLSQRVNRIDVEEKQEVAYRVNSDKLRGTN